MYDVYIASVSVFLNLGLLYTVSVSILAFQVSMSVFHYSSFSAACQRFPTHSYIHVLRYLHATVVLLTMHIDYSTLVKNSTPCMRVPFNPCICLCVFYMCNSHVTHMSYYYYTPFSTQMCVPSLLQ